MNRADTLAGAGRTNAAADDGGARRAVGEPIDRPVIERASFILCQSHAS